MDPATPPGGRVTATVGASLGALAIACFTLAMSSIGASGWLAPVGSVPAHRVSSVGHVRGFLARVGGSRVGSIIRASRARRLPTAAGGWSVAERAGAQIVGAAAALIGGLLAGVPFVPTMVGAVVAGAVPWLLARRAERVRAARIDREVPQLLDLLTAAASAGLSAPLALRSAVGGIRGPLAGEFGDAFTNVSLGVRWRDELSALAGRLGNDDLGRMVAVLARTERTGVPLADVVGGLASEVRRARRDAAMERARKAPVKMLLPLVFMILPAFLLLTVVPVLVSTVRSIR